MSLTKPFHVLLRPNLADLSKFTLVQSCFLKSLCCSKFKTVYTIQIKFNIFGETYNAKKTYINIRININP